MVWQIIEKVLTDTTLLAGLILLIRKEIRETAEHRWKAEDRSKKDNPPEL